MQNTNSKVVTWGITTLLVLLLLAGWLADLRAPLWEALPGGLKTTAMVLAGLLGAGLSILAAYGLTRLFSRWFPIARAYELTYTQSDWKDFRRLSWISMLVFITVAAALAMVLYPLLNLLARAPVNLVAALFAIPVGPGFWTLPAAIGGSCGATLLTYQIFRWRMKERFLRYLAFHNQRLGFDQRKAGLALVTFGLLFCLGLAWIGLNLPLGMDQNGLVTNRFFGLIEQRHAYTDITLLQELVHGEEGSPDLAREYSFVIQFKDGSQWRSGAYDARAVPDSVREALEYAAQRSGVPLEVVVIN